MLRLIRTIASLSVALAASAAGGAAMAGETGVPAAPPSADGSAPSAPASAPVAPSTPAAPPVQNQGTPAVVLDAQDYEGLLGRSVRAANGDDLGRVIDVITDRDGRPRAAIIDFGGFLGVGSRKIAVEWRALKFSTDGKTPRITLALNRNQVRVSPEYKPGEPIVVLGPAAPGAPPPEGDAAAAQAAVQQAAPPAAPPPAAPAPEKTPVPDKPEKSPER